jgi:hypothetical protein
MLAAAQFIPARKHKAAGEPDYWIERDDFDSGVWDVRGRKLADWRDVAFPIQLVLSGWFDGRFMKSRRLPEQVSPLVISTHINETDALRSDSRYDHLFRQGGVGSLMHDGQEMFRGHAPVGCRDAHTLSLMQSHGIAAFLSSCATLLTERPSSSTTRHNADLHGPILVVDAEEIYPQEYARRVPVEVRSLAVRAPSHVLAAGLTCEAKIELARAALRRYADARCVITSRLHAALPSLAMGTPVFFVFPEDELKSDARFDPTMRTLLGLDPSANASWNWQAPAISLAQRNLISKQQAQLHWRLEFFHSIGN